MGAPRDGVREIEPLLREFLSRLEERLAVDGLAVFGSRARNDHWTDSDVDLVVVSPVFEGMRRRDRIEALLEQWPGGVACEPLGYTPEELLRVDTPLLWEILSDGRPVKPGAAWERARARLQAMLEGGALARTPGGGWWDRRVPSPSDREDARPA